MTTLPHRPLPILTLCGHTLPFTAPASTRRSPRTATAPEALETLGEAVWTHASPAPFLVDELAAGAVYAPDLAAMFNSREVLGYTRPAWLPAPLSV